jgi:hypothetical protein
MLVQNFEKQFQNQNQNQRLLELDLDPKLAQKLTWFIYLVVLIKN